MPASIKLTRSMMSGISPTIQSYVEAYQVRNAVQGKSRERVRRGWLHLISS